MKKKLKISSSNHPQANQHTEVVNCSWENLLRCLVRAKPKGWDLILPQKEFEYNEFFNRSTTKSLIHIVYGSSPRNYFEL